MLDLFKRLFTRRDATASLETAPASAPRTGPPGTDDPRQGGRGPHDPVPRGHDAVLYSLVMVLRGNMGGESLADSSRIADMAGFWGFDREKLAQSLATRTPMLDSDELVAQLRDTFSPHDFEKAVAILVIALAGREMDGLSMRMFADFARVSGHGEDRFIHYLDEGQAMQRALGIGLGEGS